VPLGEQTEDLDDKRADNIVVRIARKLFHTTDYYDGDKLFTTHDGKRTLTPMLLVMVAIGGTDILFALDAIPAIFGLTQNVFIVFTATAFSLLGCASCTSSSTACSSACCTCPTGWH
jgi:tellurite resistance protein TerC